MTSDYSLEKAKAYQRKKETIRLAHLFFSPLVLFVFLASRLTHRLAAWAGFAAGPTLVLAAYFAVYFLILAGLDFGFALYSGFLLERRYGLSNQNLGGWLAEFAKKLALGFAFSLVLVEALYAIVRHFPGRWWLIAWAGFALVSYVLGELFPVLIVPLFYKYSKVEDEGLRRRILDLAARHRFPVENIYSINLSKTTKKANAALLGMGATKRVVLSDTLIANFTADEIENVVAHELGHFKNRDLWRLLGFGLAASFVMFWILGRVIEPAAFFFGLEGKAAIAGVPLYFLLFDLMGLVLLPLQNGFSRFVERQADLFSLRAVPRVDAFVSCMDKLGRIALSDPEPHPLIEWFFYDHPPIAKRIRMARALAALLLVTLAVPAARAAEEKKDPMQELFDRRQKVELMGFFLKDPKDAKLPGTPVGIEFYNQAVGYFQKNEYELAREAARQAIQQDPQNFLAYELLGDIASNEYRLPEAKANYEIAYNLHPTAALKEKIEKTAGETKVGKKLASYAEEHFEIKYHKEESRDQGFQLRELLRETYRNISQDFGFYFRNKVVVLLYDEADFKAITNQPHWVAGIYDGKVRMPINKQGFTEVDLRALTAHEVTHAFVGAMSAAQAPPWINEGLAEYEERKIKKQELIVFESAIKTKTLFPLDQLMDTATVFNLNDPLLINLFYEQSYHLVRYLVERYGMFRVKQLLGEYAKGVNSDEAVRGVLKLSPAKLEAEWKTTFSK